MARMVPFTFDTPGIAGLNKQGRTAILGQEWATRAKNLVIDGEGRLAHRLGTKAINTAAGDVPVDVETQFVGTNNSGTPTRYCGGTDGKIYELSGAGVWVDRTGFTAASNGNFKFTMFNGKVIAYHADGRQLVQTSPGTNFGNISGTPVVGVDVLSFAGRLWGINGNTLEYSNTLVETAVSGNYNLRHVWPAGHDTAVGLAEFNGNLVVFGTHSMIIYAITNFDATSLVKVEALEGAGCVNRDTIQNIGKDIVFLSADGLKSLARIIQEKSMPLADVAPQMRDYIRSEYASSTAHKVTSTYSEINGFYILSLQQTTIVVDTRLRLPNGGFRVTEWDAASAVTRDSDGGLLLAWGGDDTYKYQGVKDNVLSDGTGGDAVEGDFESGWIDFAEMEAAALLKFLKRIKLYVAGGGGSTLTLKWYFDYKEAPNTVATSIAAAATAAQYGVAQYSIDIYGTEVDVTELGKPGRKGGRVIKFGFVSQGSTTALAINQIDLFAKVGKQAF